MGSSLAKVMLEKIKDTRKKVNDVPKVVWRFHVANSLLITVLISVGVSDFGAWTLQNADIPRHLESNYIFTVVYSFPVLCFLVVFLFVQDKILLLLLHLHSKTMKKIAGFISRLDHYIWKKTRKDSYISTLLLRVSRFHKTSSFNRIIFIFFVSALFFAIMVLIRIAIFRA